MPQRKPGIRHSRVGPCMDVAMCGERGGQLMFSQSLGGVNCGVCRVRVVRNIDNNRIKREQAARVKAEKSWPFSRGRVST